MRWLIDEMFPVGVCDQLTEKGHDARSAVVDLQGLSDGQLLEVAIDEGRVVVTENVIDFVALIQARIAAGRDVATVLFELRKRLSPTPRRLATRLSRELHVGADEHPEPFPTAYWLDPSH